MLNPQGYLIQSGDKINEADSFSCGHCQAVTFVKAFQSPTVVGGMCKVCYRLICPACTTKDRCDPFEKKLEREENRYQFLKSIGLGDTYQHRNKDEE